MRALSWSRTLVLLLIFCGVQMASLAQMVRNPATAAREALRERGLKDQDLQDLRVSSRHTSAHSGVEHVYMEQRWQGVPVFNGQVAVHLRADGTVAAVHERIVQDIAARAGTPTPSLSPQQAVQQVAQREGLAIPGLAASRFDPERRRYHFTAEGWANEPFAELFWLMHEDVLRLVWNVNLHLPDGSHWWNIRVDAHSGAELERNDWVVSCQFGHADGTVHATHAPGCAAPEMPPPPPGPDTYLVYPMPVESPSHGERDYVTAPWSVAPVASPFGWHDVNGVPGPEYTITRGNNVWARDDLSGTNAGGSSPDGGVFLDFAFPLDLGEEPLTYLDASITNLFYWNNICHDVAYGYGFDEQAGNFQANNYARGGLGGDAVIADALDGSGTDNANFATPEEGMAPRMQMYRYEFTTPNRDSDLDNLVIAHEYAHGISNRLVGGPMNVNCLRNAEQMGEGWSDWFGLMLTMKAGDTGMMPRGVATYLLGQPITGQGYRPAPYSTNFGLNDFTYAATNNTTQILQPHGIGSIWCNALWEVTWDLIGLHGFDPDIHHGNGGNNIAMQLVIEGMKLTPCDPGMVDARDAILLADELIYGGAHRDMLWAAFARRGLGIYAQQGSSFSRTDQVESFALPGDADMTVDAIVSPQEGTVPLCAFASAPLTVRLRNLGLQPQTGFPVKYRMDQGPVTTVVFSGSIPPGGTATLDLAGPLGASIPAGFHVLEVWCELPNDTQPLNDLASVRFFLVDEPVRSLPYLDDFEADDFVPHNACDQLGLLAGGWVNEQLPGRMQYKFLPGSPAEMQSTGGPSAIPGTDHTTGTAQGGLLYLAASSACSAPDMTNKRGSVVGPCLSLANTTAPQLTFAYNLGSNQQRMDVEIYHAGQWHMLKSMIFILAPGWTTTADINWHTETIPLHEFAGSMIALRFTGHGLSSSTVLLDDVRVEDLYQPLVAAIGTEGTSVCMGGHLMLRDETACAVPVTQRTWTIEPTNFLWVNGTGPHSAEPEAVLLGDGPYTVKLRVDNGIEQDSTTLQQPVTLVAGVPHTLHLRLGQYGEDVTWQVRHTGGGAVLASGGPYQTIPMPDSQPQPPVTFCLPAQGCYEFVLNSYGICCDDGAGWFELVDNMGRTVVQGTMTNAQAPQLVVPFCSPGDCIQQLPYTMDFDNGYPGWRQSNTDDTDWRPWSGPTPTAFTGPDGDHTTGNGTYMYLEAGPATWTDTIETVLVSPCFDLTGVVDPVLSFWFHMRLGVLAGHSPAVNDTLAVDVEVAGVLHRNVWFRNGFQGQQWNEALVDLSPFAGEPVRFHFRAKKTKGDRKDMAIDDILVAGSPGLRFNLSMGLAGAWDANAGLMRDDLRRTGLLPLVEPYTTAGYVHLGDGGGENVSPLRLSMQGEHAVVDWVLVELWPIEPPLQPVATQSALLLRNGRVAAANGDTILGFAIPPGNYLPAVRHRNHLACMSQYYWNFPPGSLAHFDLTQPGFVGGVEPVRIINGKGFLWPGDVNGDGMVRYTGANNDRDPILQTVGGVVPTNTAGGYLPGDVNLDGFLRYTGSNNDRDPILQTVGGVIPTNTRVEQMP